MSGAGWIGALMWHNRPSIFAGLPMKFVFAVLALIVVFVIIPFVVPIGGESPGVDPNANLPWQIELDGQGGSTVFGLKPGVSTLADVRQKFGPDMDVAIIAEPDEVGLLEGYYSQVVLGFVIAKVVVTVNAQSEVISEIRERALRARNMESTTRKITLHPDDLAAVEKMSIKAISVIPSVNLDETTVIQRFGAPGERVVVSEKRVHLLYPEKGLDVVVDSDGKELLQYVAPRDFALLRDPLKVVESSKQVAQ